MFNSGDRKRTKLGHVFRLPTQFKFKPIKQPRFAQKGVFSCLTELQDTSFMTARCCQMTPLSKSLLLWRFTTPTPTPMPTGGEGYPGTQIHIEEGGPVSPTPRGTPPHPPPTPDLPHHMGGVNQNRPELIKTGRSSSKNGRS